MLYYGNELVKPMREVEFSCPGCETELKFPEDQAYAYCPRCGLSLDIQSILAYLRGLEAFEEGQEIMIKTNPGKFRFRPRPPDQRAFTLFREAYSSLQLAFSGTLEENQRQLGIEMMASMAQEFARYWMVSDLEGVYWRTAMAELASQKEYNLLKEKVNRSRRMNALVISRWYWVQRQKQLLNVLRELNRKLTQLERQIEFVDIPKARDRNWAP